jgi:hypothetical protein
LLTGVIITSVGCRRSIVAGIIFVLVSSILVRVGIIWLLTISCTGSCARGGVVTGIIVLVLDVVMFGLCGWYDCGL